MEQSQTNFQLSQKVMCQNVSHLNDAIVERHLIDLLALKDSEEWFEVEDQQVQMFTVNNPGATSELVACSLKPSGGNQKMKVQFGCRCTHNEQVIVQLCRIENLDLQKYPPSIAIGIQINYCHT